MNERLALNRVPAENLSQKIYAIVRQKLILGDITPGSALSIRTVAEEYSVSAMPVREALRQLASEDALIGAAKKAYRVPDLSPDAAANLFFVRSVLEGAASELAVKNLTPDDIHDLEDLALATDEAWKTGHAERYIAANLEFHSRINARTGNAALENMITGLYARTGPWMAQGVTKLIQADRIQDNHSKIVETLKQRDPKKTRRLVEKDAQWAINLYRRIK